MFHFLKQHHAADPLTVSCLLWMNIGEDSAWGFG